MKYLTAEQVLLIHEQVISNHELQGLAANKSLEAVLARIDNRLYYGIITDVYELAACYATYIAVGHVFNDANKRTAYASMKICLDINGIPNKFGVEEVGQVIIKVAQGAMDEIELATWLRKKCS
ncbi:death-on-curing protein [Achromatium sp. WMS3]|nr:death-on-curing protein [Achromatium sp. WMS3]